MSLRARLLKRLDERKRDASDWIISSDVGTGRKRTLIAGQIANSVMPRRILLSQDGRTLAMDVGHRRICAAVFRNGNQVVGTFDFTTSMPETARAVFDQALSALIGMDGDLVIGFLPSDKTYPEAVGAAPETILSADDPDIDPVPEPAVDPARSVASAASDQPAVPLRPVATTTETVATTFTPSVLQPAASPAPGGDAATRFRTMAREHAERVAGFAGDTTSASGDAELSTDCSDAFRDFLGNVSDALGKDLLCVVVPDGARTQFAVALSEDSGAAAEFRPNRLARVLRAWETAKAGERSPAL